MDKLLPFALYFIFIIGNSVCEAFDESKYMAVGVKCKEETNTPDDEVQKMINKEPVSSPEGQCMMACIFKEMGILTSDGKFDVDANIKAAEEAFKDDEKKVNRAKEFADYCKDRVEAVDDDEKGCKRAGVMHSCALEKLKQLGIN